MSLSKKCNGTGRYTTRPLRFLDVSVGGEEIYPVATILSRRNIPFALSTGYSKGGLPAEYRDRPILPKPYLPHEIPRAIVAALSESA